MGALLGYFDGEKKKYVTTQNPVTYDIPAPDAIVTEISQNLFWFADKLNAFRKNSQDDFWLLPDISLGDQEYISKVKTNTLYCIEHLPIYHIHFGYAKNFDTFVKTNKRSYGDNHEHQIQRREALRSFIVDKAYKLFKQDNDPQDYAIYAERFDKGKDSFILENKTDARQFYNTLRIEYLLKRLDNR